MTTAGMNRHHIVYRDRAGNIQTARRSLAKPGSRSEAASLLGIRTNQIQSLVNCDARHFNGPPPRR